MTSPDLAQVFRSAQAAAGQQAADYVSALWDSKFSISEARASWADMRPSIMLLIQGRQMSSSLSASRYYAAARLAAGLPYKKIATSDVLADDSYIGNVIDSTGIGAFLHQVKGGAMMMDASTSARNSLGAAVSRLVLAGGRDAVLALADADPDSAGWNRVTGGTCDWCEEQSAAGIVVGGDFPAHDHCECTADPAFTAEDVTASDVPDAAISDESVPSGLSPAAIDAARTVASVTDAPSLGTAIDTISQASVTTAERNRLRKLAAAHAVAIGLTRGQVNG